VNEPKDAGPGRRRSLAGKQFGTARHFLGDPALTVRQSGRLAQSCDDRVYFQGGFQLGEQHEQWSDLLGEEASVDPLGHVIW